MTKRQMKKWKSRIPALLLCVALLSTTGCGLFEKKGDEGSEFARISSYVPDPEGDDDGDGLLNKEESELGTDLFSADTDGDGLIDEMEVHTLMTNPLLADTDKDKLTDGVEYEMGLDPLKKRSNGWLADGWRDFTKTYEVEGCTLEVEGNAQIADIYVDTLDYCGISNTPGVASDLYEFYMEDMEFDHATLTLSYDKEEMKEKGYNEDHLVIYQFMEDGTFREVGGSVDKETGTVTVELEHFSKYVIADKTLMQKEYASNVFLLLDNSGSMYPPEDCPGSDGNDIYFKRVDMAKQLIEMTDDKVHYGLAKFTADYTELNGGFANSKEDLYASLDAIKTAGEKFSGTKIEEATMAALENFGEEEAASRKFIVLLTDGESIKSSVDIDTVIEEANKKNVCIIAVGLGNAVNDARLSLLAKATGGFYIYANDDNALDKLYETITTKLNYNYVDLDGDGVNDSILCADSGFDVTEDSFNIYNYCLEPDVDCEMTGGQCYGMSMIAQLHYKGKLPLKGEMVPRHWLSGVNGGEYESNGYDLSKVSFFANEGSPFASTKNNLFDFKLSEAWELYNTTPFEKKGELYQFHQSNDRYIIFDPEAINTKESAVLQTRAVEVNAANYDLREDFYFTLKGDVEEFSQEDKDKHAVLGAIYNYHIQQDTENVVVYDLFGISFGDHFLDEADRETVPNSMGIYAIQEKHFHFKQFIDYMNNGVVPLLTGHDHAVNAIRLYRDINDPNKFTVIIANSNCPGQEQKMEIVRTKALFGKDGYNDYLFEIYDTNNAFLEGFGKKLILEYEIHSSLVNE